MKPHPRIRKTVKWGGAVVSALLLVAWVGSMFYWVSWWNPSTGDVRIGRGCAGVERIHPTSVQSNPAFPPAPWQFYCRAGSFKEVRWLGCPNSFSVGVPLWAPLVLALAVTMWAWVADAFARRRANAHLCPKCRYNRTGLAPGAVCPECGATSPAAS